MAPFNQFLGFRLAHHNRILATAATTQSHKMPLILFAEPLLCVRNGTNMKLSVIL
jgi:hypothetical protein